MERTDDGLLYLALVDMVPELHRKTWGRKFLTQTTALLAGLGLMGWLKEVFEH